VVEVPLVMRTRATRSPALNVSPAKDRPPLGDAGAMTVSISAPAGSKYSSFA